MDANPKLDYEATRVKETSPEGLGHLLNPTILKLNQAVNNKTFKVSFQRVQPWHSLPLPQTTLRKYSSQLNNPLHIL